MKTTTTTALFTAIIVSIMSVACGAANQKAVESPMTPMVQEEQSDSSMALNQGGLGAPGVEISVIEDDESKHQRLGYATRLTDMAPNGTSNRIDRSTVRDQ